MSNYCQNCYELTEELENHKRWLNDYKQKLQDAEEIAIAKITQCANLIKQLNETHKQLDQLKKENKELKDLNTRLDNQRETYWKEYKTLKQALQEIKEIAEDAKTKVFVDMEDFWEQILQKCEVIKDANIQS